MHGRFSSSVDEAAPALSLGITPGLSSVGYCFLAFEPAGRILTVDWDVLIGTRPSQRKKLGIPEPTPQSSPSELMKRFRVHGYLLEVLMERHTPVVVAIGPPSRSREPAVFWQAAAAGIEILGDTLGVPVHRIDKPAINRTFPGAHFARDIQEHLADPITSTDRRVLLAAASAYVAFELERPKLAAFNRGQLTA